MLQRTITFNRTKSFEHLLEKFLEFTTSGNYKVSGERDPWIFVRKRSLIILKFSGNFQRNEILKNLCQKRGFRKVTNFQENELFESLLEKVFFQGITNFQKNQLFEPLSERSFSGFTEH